MISAALFVIIIGAITGARGRRRRVARLDAMAMSSAPIDIPLDERGAPILAALIDSAGRRYAASVGEEYIEDSFRRAKEASHQGGYRHITAEEWRAFDAATAAYQRALRGGLPAPAVQPQKQRRER